jgi:hypothetical protein
MTSGSALQVGVTATCKKFIFEVMTLGFNTTAIYHNVSGLDDGNSYGRYFSSGDPLVPYNAAFTSIPAMIQEASSLRFQLKSGLLNLWNIAAEGNIEQDIQAATRTVISDLANCCANAFDQINLLKILATFTAPPFRNLGTDQFSLQIQQAALDYATYCRVATLFQLGKAVSNYLPKSQIDALAVRNGVIGLIDREMMLSASTFKDLYYNSLNMLRRQIAQYLNLTGSQIEPIIKYTFPKPLPSLVLAYRLYQDTTREPELVARNDPTDPSYMPVTVEALLPT